MPFYAITFDKDGVCTSPVTQNNLIQAANDASDVFVYAHGWNNDWPAAKARFEGFLKGASALAKMHGSLLPQGFKPIFVGIVWPSTALTFSWEDAPDFAGDGAEDGLASNVDEAKAIRDLLPPAEIQNFDTLVATRRNLTVEGGRLLARIIAPVLANSVTLTAPKWSCPLMKSSPAAQARSVLLLQPAISHLCFAADLGDGKPGGYRKAPMSQSSPAGGIDSPWCGGWPRACEAR